jgi:acetyl/propionyl-CoA carboxylase alpha subunit
MKYQYQYRDRMHSVELIRMPEGFQGVVDGRQVKPEGQVAVVAAQGRKVWVHYEGRTYGLERAEGSGKAARASGELVLRAPMPGQVRQVAVAAGQVVTTGDLLLVLEAMKMEIRISAPQAAKVAQITVSVGHNVEKDQILVELESESA